MANYLRPQSVEDVLRNAAAIYGRNFSVIFVTYFLPVFPIMVLWNEAQMAGAWGLVWRWVALICWMVATSIASGPITIAVSDICLGNKPSVARSYQKIFNGGVLGRLFVASLLQTLCLVIGLVLCVVPGVLAMSWFMFTPPAVMLEGLGGTKALQRSKRLGQGYLGRNLLVLLLIMIIGGVIGGILVALLQLLQLELEETSFLYQFVMAAIQTMLLMPFWIIAIILLYYDLRVRKEAYDAAALAEDLRR